MLISASTHENGSKMHPRGLHCGGGCIQAPKTRPQGLLRVGVAESDRPLSAQVLQRRFGRRRLVENLLRHRENEGPPQIFRTRALGPRPGINPAVQRRLERPISGRRPLPHFGIPSRDRSSLPNSAGSGRRARRYGACHSGGPVSRDKNGWQSSRHWCPGKRSSITYGHDWPHSG